MVTDKTDVELDLDALAPPSVKINFKSKAISVTPPTLEQYAKVIDFSEQLSNLKDNDFTTVANVYKNIEDFVKEVIPELKDEVLNFAQLSSLFKLLAQVGSPTDKALEKLKEQGINLKADESPKDSASSEPS